MMRPPVTQACIDRPLSIAVMLWAGLSGVYTTVIMPLIVSGSATALGLSTGTASSVAASEMAGVALGSFIAGMRVQTDDRSRLVMLGAALAVLANAGSAWVDNLTVLLGFRLLAGIGGGALLAAMAAGIGATSHAERNFAIFVAAAFLLATIGFRVLPEHVAAAGVDVLFVLLAGANGLTVITARWFPAHAPTAAVASAAPANAASTPATTIRLKWETPVLLSLGGILTYYVGVGGVWPVMARIGASLGLSNGEVGEILAGSSIAAMSGALIAAALGLRLGRVVSVVGGLSGVVISLIGLKFLGSTQSFRITPVLFLFCWNFTVPYLMGTVAALDPSGRAVALNMTLQYVGFAVGPLLAGVLVQHGNPLSSIWLGIAGVAMSLVFFAAALRGSRH